MFFRLTLCSEQYGYNTRSESWEHEGTKPSCSLAVYLLSDQLVIELKERRSLARIIHDNARDVLSPKITINDHSS